MVNMSINKTKFNNIDYRKFARIYGQVRDQISNPVWNKINGRVFSQVDNQIWRLRNRIKDRLEQK
jgi:hypothetical protein